VVTLGEGQRKDSEIRTEIAVTTASAKVENARTLVSLSMLFVARRFAYAE